MSERVELLIEKAKAMKPPAMSTAFTQNMEYAPAGTAYYCSHSRALILDLIAALALAHGSVVSPASAGSTKKKAWSALPLRQKQALGWLRVAREEQPSTDDGIVYGGKTFYDREIKVAYVNFQTARALRRKGHVTFGPWDPDWGTSITLVAVPGAATGEDAA